MASATGIQETCVRHFDTVLHQYICVLQHTNLLNGNFSLGTYLTRLYVVCKYIVIKAEMADQPNVLYISIIFQTFVPCSYGWLCNEF